MKGHALPKVEALNFQCMSRDGKVNFIVCACPHHLTLKTKIIVYEFVLVYYINLSLLVSYSNKKINKLKKKKPFLNHLGFWFKFKQVNGKFYIN